MVMISKLPKKEYDIISFETPKLFNSWLKKNHDKSPGIWIKFYKKDSGVQSVVYAEALDEALCYGWIDSQSKSLDEKAYLQKFTPRGTKSMWSKRNREHIARLSKEKRIMPAGLTQIENAKKDGRWDDAYDSPKNMTVPPEFLKLLAKNKIANAFYKTLSKTNTYAISWRLQTAKKPETREKRIKTIITMLEQGVTFH
jgi:uncharacterized protein YdeI (YjbR/CyaY-like superfamily)